MEGGHHNGGHGQAPPANHQLNFIQALSGPKNSNPSSSIAGKHKGEIAIKFPTPLVAKYSEPYQYALVGKFPHGRPTLEVIQNFFISQDLATTFTVGLMGSKHVLLNFNSEKDLLRIYSRSIWYIDSKPMRIFKWTPYFHVDRESSIVPLWFKLPKLPVHLSNKETLFDITKQFVTPLRIDSATQNGRRPNVATIQVEVDLQKEIPKRIWMEIGDSFGYWQPIETEEMLPAYCNYCWHLGHSE
ncbi:OLC1v1035474C1 [Oldenlandia corymbosa var. corymbosa]|uniref:OLC1v1035474C1 n=1 Tax=Oldenlandia corymbosa var. corymbosa TaxID=529605 RepID=A0AAV1CU98_OLDCO|nr:OLC1v1035474C1 [Oldenlandia corymbosa var. corymbosa]